MIRALKLSDRKPSQPLFQRTGNAAVEFALVAPVLVSMLMGMADYGLEVYYNTELQLAVRAAGQYANTTGHGTDQTGIAATIQGTSSLSGIVVAPLVEACECANGAAVACSGGTCADGSAVGSYVTISATYTYTSFIKLFNSKPRTLTSTLTVRTS